MLEVEVNPGDVVAIPSDYNHSKIRVCRYKVLGVVKTEYSDSSLRVVDPDYVAPEEEDDCVECGDFGCQGECQDESFCEECGADCEYGYDLCVDCEDDINSTATVRDDRYPFEDEFEDD
jgi:hypothetical protein